MIQHSRFPALLFALVLAACTTASAPQRHGEAMIAAADPRAVEAGLQMLREGGSAVDAAIAVEAVLGLVEPQSSGVGGGGFMMFYDGHSHAIAAYDGRERAPAGATPDMFLVNGQPMAFFDAEASGRSTGTPSVIAMLKLAHDQHGRLPWAHLFEPAIALADNGFVISPRLANSIRLATQYGNHVREDPAARDYFYDTDGNPWPVGHVLRNPAYAETLRRIAAEGPQALTHGAIADAIIAATHREPRAGTLSLEDLQAYAPRRLEPICGTFRVYRVCGPPSPSSGGTAVLAILGLYERARPHPDNATDVDDWSAFLWASRLAYADRDHYFGDTDFVPVPQHDMIAPAYLDQRARQIDLAHAPRSIMPGEPAGHAMFERWGRDETGDHPGTSHMAIIDSDGNAVSMTATVESIFGSQRMVGGFFLNNQLTDFSFVPTINGKPVANAVAPRKRPRSSMAPTIVTDHDGRLVMVIGSPGGSGIIAYVSRALIGALDWNQPLQTSVDTGNVVAAAPNVRVESSRLPPGLAQALTARGWTVQEIASEQSGLQAIRVTPDGLVGAADSRREGVTRSLPAH